MPKYCVTIYYHTECEVMVDAASEDEAVALAYDEAGRDAYNPTLLHNLQVDGDPDIRTI